MSTLTHIDQRYIEGLLQNDSRIVRQIYEQFADKIKAYIINNSGTGQDAADIFQEALTAIYQQAKHKQLQLTCPFEPFLLLVCKRKWLNELKKRSGDPVTNHPADVYDNIGEDVFAMSEQIAQQEGQTRLFMHAFRQLGEKCRQIIQRSLQDEHQEKIAESLGVTYGYLRKKKSECMATLLKIIRSQQ
jgi:RNA polymerase sigma factor (sigma-70 family)